MKRREARWRQCEPFRRKKTKPMKNHRDYWQKRKKRKRETSRKKGTEMEEQLKSDEAHGKKAKP